MKESAALCLRFWKQTSRSPSTGRRGDRILRRAARGAMLLIRSLHKLQHVSLGIRSKKLWSVEFNMPATKYPNSKSMWAIRTGISVEGLSQPGVTSVASASATSARTGHEHVDLRSTAGRRSQKGFSGQYHAVSPEYLTTMRMNVLRSGERFTWKRTPLVRSQSP